MIGLAFKNLGKNQAAAAVLSQQPSKDEFVIFTQDKEPSCLPVETSVLDLVKAYDFTYPIIAFDSDTAFNLMSCYNKWKYFYIDDIISYTKCNKLDMVIGDERFTKVCRSKEHADHLKIKEFVEDYNLNKIKELVNAKTV